MLEFTKDEFLGRLDKIKEKMRERNIHVLLVTDLANMNYITGYNA